ncbi:hypothetical protein Bhyg_01279, partial [Pseudolycoriella hygida]
MILLIWLLIALLQNFSCNAYTNDKVIENVYIDSLIERYLTEENDLWVAIYANSSDRRLANHQIQTESYMTLDMTFQEYNFTRVDQIFREIAQDSNSTCTSWSTEMEATTYKLYMFYEILSANVLTSYMRSQRANMNLVVKKGFETHDSENLRTRFNLLYNEITNVAVENLRTRDRITWMCDRNATGDDGHSQEITNFIRGYVDNQINFNKEESCWGSCSDYNFARHHVCHNGTFCYDNRKVGEVDPVCRGTIFDCSFIEEKMEICPSLNGRNRRYEYINYGCTYKDRLNFSRCNQEGRYFGPSGNCETKPTIVDSFRNAWFVKCHYCFCYCDEHDDVESDRYFSLQPIVSDVRDNMIITGVAIIKRNGIFSWTATQSRLLPNGRVDQYQSEPARSEIFTDFKRSDFSIIEGTDYHKLSWQKRSVNLDTIILPPGHVVTGVRFTVEGGSLSLEVRSTTFNFNSGTLLDQNEWISKGYRERTGLHIDRPEPNRYCDIYGAYLSVPDFRPNKFVKFRPSDPDKDAGQTTVPFIDTQMVRPKNLSPLSGISLYYKGKPGLGGFIAPAIVMYDMSSHIGNRLVP